ncbi:hypothetical protein BRC81_04825 [Halobacteriales archaeon QS_1_68_20]|nr:MAG: hypothetical protein BRC81_04825 [Halobacteriales archaeon QS_1_68_20]
MVAVVVIASAVIGTAAFNSGQVDRSVTVDVVGDDAAVTGLSPGSSSLVYYNANNKLTVDFSNVANANGVNANSTYTVGDNSSATTDPAFQITNNDGATHTYTLSYSFATAPSSGDVKFHVYNSTGTYLGTVDSSTDVSFDLTSGETAYVVMDLDAFGATVSDDLSGTFTVKVN